MLIKSYDYQAAYFVTSAPDIHHISINDEGIEIAFTGRSNAGKSSVLNALTNQKNLARISKTPGRTQLINLFEVETGIRLVDLPGYGYAKAPKKMRYEWQDALSRYLKKRKSLKGLVISMDIRHPMQDADQKIVQWAIDADIPALVLLTKADKLTFSAREKQLKQVRKMTLASMGNTHVEMFSSLKKKACIN